MEIIKSIISNVLTALYEPFGFALILTVLFLFVCMYAREHGWREIVKKWINCFRTNREFRIAFFLIFYTAMILFRTLLNRNLWENPLSDVIGIWGLYDKDGKMTTEAIENLVLFIPFSIFLLWSRWEKDNRFHVKQLLQNPVVSCSCSLWQLSLHSFSFGWEHFSCRISFITPWAVWLGECCFM